MKSNAKSMPLITAALALLTLALRCGLYLLGTDEKGLLIPGHILDILSWAVTAAALVLCFLGCPKQKATGRYQDYFSPSRSAAVGAIAMAAALALTILPGWGRLTRLELIRNLCGLFAVPALVWVGVCRLQGKQPLFGCHAAACLYLTLYTVSHYQTWCSQPQLQDYVFSMAGAICLTLFSYHQTAFDADRGKGRWQRLLGLLAGFFCLAALISTQDLPLYLGGAIWALTNLSHAPNGDSHAAA